MQTASFNYLTSLPLKHNGDCSLIGVADDLTVHVEETYSEDAWLAQHTLRLDGTMIFSQDEDGGASFISQPLPMPPNLAKPHTCWQTMSLNFAGPRRRGLQGSERVRDLVRPLTVPDKIALVKRLRLNMPPPLLLGIAESYVLAEALLLPDLYFVCRRVRLAFALPQEQVDGDGQPYDYDTLALYAAHLYPLVSSEETPLAETLEGLPGVEMVRPMDCVFHQNHLFVADGGDDSRLSAIHVWQVELPPRETPDQRLSRKLYG